MTVVEALIKLAEAVGGLCVLVATHLIKSHIEHKGTKKDTVEIKMFINGEMEKKLSEAREEGRQEILQSQNKTSL